MKNWVSYALFTHLCSLPDSKTITTISQLFLLFHSNFPRLSWPRKFVWECYQKKRELQRVLCLEFLFFKTFNLLHVSRKTLTSKIPYILVKNRLCFPDHHSVKIYTSPLFAWASARAAFCTDISIQPCQAIQHCHALEGSTQELTCHQVFLI